MVREVENYQPPEGACDLPMLIISAICCHMSCIGHSNSSPIHNDMVWHLHSFSSTLKKYALKNESTCDGHRKYFQQPTKVLSLALESTFIFRATFLLVWFNDFS